MVLGDPYIFVIDCSNKKVASLIVVEPDVFGTGMSTPQRPSNSNARTDMMSSIVQFGSIRQISGARSLFMDFVNCPQCVTSFPDMPPADVVIIKLSFLSIGT